MSRVLVFGLGALWLLAAQGSITIAAAQAVRVHAVKRLDFGSPERCPTNEQRFLVSARDGIRPRLRILVTLKPDPDPVTAQEIQLRIELVDERGAVVRLLDSTQVEATTNPPWREPQLAGEFQHQVDFTNRLPPRDRIGMPRYWLRVSLDTAKAGELTKKPFLLYWPELGEQACKTIR